MTKSNVSVSLLDSFMHSYKKVDQDIKSACGAYTEAYYAEVRTFYTDMTDFIATQKEAEKLFGFDTEKYDEYMSYHTSPEKRQYHFQ